MSSRFTIVGLGEALFDIFPDRQVLGGAPLNVAYHAHQVASRKGGQGVAVSRIGQDELGDQVVRQVTSMGMTAEFLQRDPDRDTGKVYVGIDDKGKPHYDIVRDVAWDWLQFDPDLERLAQRCEAVCFGSLVQRNGQSRNTVYRFLEAAKRAVRMFDVNLRQTYYDRSVLNRSFEFATVVKLNEEELPVVAQTLGVLASGIESDALADVRVAELLKRYPNVKAFALTRGARGTLLYQGGEKVDGEPVSYPFAPNADAVGAGDACSAGLLLGMVLRWPAKRTVGLANHLGAFVASQPGATPTLPASILQMVD